MYLLDIFCRLGQSTEVELGANSCTKAQVERKHYLADTLMTQQKNKGGANKYCIFVYASYLFKLAAELSCEEIYASALNTHKLQLICDAVTRSV